MQRGGSEKLLQEIKQLRGEMAAMEERMIQSFGNQRQSKSDIQNMMMRVLRSHQNRMKAQQLEIQTEKSKHSDPMDSVIAVAQKSERKKKDSIMEGRQSLIQKRLKVQANAIKEKMNAIARKKGKQTSVPPTVPVNITLGQQK